MTNSKVIIHDNAFSDLLRRSDWFIILVSVRGVVVREGCGIERGRAADG